MCAVIWMREKADMSVKIKAVSSRHQIVVTVEKPFWKEFLQY